MQELLCYYMENFDCGTVEYLNGSHYLDGLHLKLINSILNDDEKTVDEILSIGFYVDATISKYISERLPHRLLHIAFV